MTFDTSVAQAEPVEFEVVEFEVVEFEVVESEVAATRQPVPSGSVPWRLARRFVSVVVLALSGCALAPTTPVLLTVVSTAPEKDVIYYQIEIAEPLEPIQYLGWTESTMQAIGYEPINPLHPDCPVYEIYYSFLRGPTLLASVQYRRDERRSDQPLRHVRTLVHSRDGSAAPDRP